MQKHLINGEWIGTKLASFPVIDPSSGKIIDEVAEGDENDVDNAVSYALESYFNQKWKEDALLRSNALYRWANCVEKSINELSVLLTRENGKLISESRIELKSAVNTLRFAAGQARMLEGRSLTLGLNIYGQVVAEPVGVVCIIVPWNWPVLLMIRELAPALAAGNTVVVKLPSYAPLTCMKILALTLKDNEIPKGDDNAII